MLKQLHGMLENICRRRQNFYRCACESSISCVPKTIISKVVAILKEANQKNNLPHKITDNVTFHGKTYINAFLFNGLKRLLAVRLPLERFRKS